MRRTGLRSRDSVGYFFKFLASAQHQSVGLPPRKISSFLRSVKDDQELKTPGVHSIPCECGQVYIRQTGRSIDTKLKELQRHIRLEYADNSAVALRPE
jgi:hypothetical protein